MIGSAKGFLFFEVVEKLLLNTFFDKLPLFMPFLASEGCFWPLTASMTLGVKNNYAYVITQGCMVSRPNRLLQCSTTMSLIKRIEE